MKSREIALVSFILVLVSFIIRFPFFFRLVLDWDESTYILMGQSVLDGHLPYTELWDNKPPLLFYLVGAFIAVFGKGVAGVRIGGTICVALSSLFVYMITRKLWENRTVSMLAALLFILASSNILDGNATLSEHMALALLLPGIYLFLTDIPPSRKYFFMGLLLTSASLIRMNLAFVSLGAGIFIFGYYLYKRDLALWFSALLSYSLGMLLGILISVLPYLLSGKLAIWWSSVVIAPLAYSTSQFTFIEILGIQLKFIYQFVLHFPYSNSLTALLLISGSLGILLIILKWKDVKLRDRKGIIFLMVVLLFTELSILLGGAFWPHYMIQLLPVLCMATAVLLLHIKKPVWRLASLLAIMLILLYSQKTTFYEYKVIAREYQNNGRLSHGTAYEIVSFINENHIPKEKVFLLTQHIVYWMLDTPPFDKIVTHPSNLHLKYLINHIRETSTTPLMEMTRLLQRAPEVIVIPDKYIHYVDPAADSLLNAELAEHYILARSVDEISEKTLIFQRLPASE